jgi:hypothetical protein
MSDNAPGNLNTAHACEHPLSDHNEDGCMYPDPAQPNKIAFCPCPVRVVISCVVPDCPIGKRAAWDALGDDSPAQDYAMHIHEHYHREPKS